MARKKFSIPKPKKVPMKKLIVPTGIAVGGLILSQILKGK
jgi:hypothetical protein